MEAPRWDVWAFHFKRVERTDVPANIVLGLPQLDPVREHSMAGRSVPPSTVGVPPSARVGGAVAAELGSKSSGGRGRALPGPMEKFVFARPPQLLDESTRTAAGASLTCDPVMTDLPTRVVLDAAGN